MKIRTSKILPLKPLETKAYTSIAKKKKNHTEESITRFLIFSASTSLSLTEQALARQMPMKVL